MQKDVVWSFLHYFATCPNCLSYQNDAGSMGLSAVCDCDIS